MATTEKVAVCPAVTVWLAGCVVMLGATGAGFTVRVAGTLVMLLTEFVTVTVMAAPLSAVVVGAVVKVGEFVPTAAPFSFH